MKIVYFTHSLASCWNHGNAHFLRGVLRELSARGHEVRALEPEALEPRQSARRSRRGRAGACRAAYPELSSHTVRPCRRSGSARRRCRPRHRPRMERAGAGRRARRAAPAGRSVSPCCSTTRITARSASPRRCAPSTCPAMTACWRSARRWRRSIAAGAGATACGPGTRRPTPACSTRRQRRRAGGPRLDRQLGRRRAHARDRGLPVRPAARGRSAARHLRRPLSRRGAGDAGSATARAITAGRPTRARRRSSRALATVHVPRRYYATILPGIPTIRVFEALACGIPLVSAPWDDAEQLFRPGEDYLVAADGAEMTAHLRSVAGRSGPARRARRRGAGDDPRPPHLRAPRRRAARHRRQLDARPGERNVA